MVPALNEGRILPVWKDVEVSRLIEVMEMFDSKTNIATQQVSRPDKTKSKI